MKRSLSQLTRLSFFTVLVCALPPLFPQSNDTLPGNFPSLSAKVKSNKILLAKKGSYLENAVSRIIVDSLSSRGFIVNIIDVKSLADQDPNQYRASIIFSGIEGSRLFEPVTQYKSNLSLSRSNILICRVNGELWDDGKQGVDAVAAATRIFDPPTIALKILRKTYLVIENTNDDTGRPDRRPVRPPPY